MADCFLFFRCWPGIIANFSVEEINPLDNDEIEPALNRHALDWLRSHRAEVRKLAKQRIVTRREAIKRRQGVYLARPDGYGEPRPQRPSVRTRRSPRKSLFRRVGDYAGWFTQESLAFEDKESGEVKSVGPLVAVYHTEDQEFAEEVIRTLNCDWSKYESGYPRRAYDSTSDRLEEPLWHLETELNPRFGLLHAPDVPRERLRLMLSQVANIKRDKPPDVLHPDLHLAIAQRALEVIDELEVTWRLSKPPTDSTEATGDSDEKQLKRHENDRKPKKEKKRAPAHTEKAVRAAIEKALADRKQGVCVKMHNGRVTKEEVSKRCKVKIGKDHLKTLEEWRYYRDNGRVRPLNEPTEADRTAAADLLRELLPEHPRLQQSMQELDRDAQLKRLKELTVQLIPVTKLPEDKQIEVGHATIQQFSGDTAKKVYPLVTQPGENTLAVPRFDTVPPDEN